MARNTQRSRVRTVRRLRQLRNAVASCPLGAVERESAQPSAYSLLSHERAGAVLTTRPTLRDLPYFAESASTGIPRTLRPCTPDLPMVWCPRPGAGPTDAVTAGVVLRELIDRELPGTGALLFRNLQGFGVSGANDFAQLISGLGYDLFDYAGGVTKRNAAVPNQPIFPLSEEPSSVSMEPHSDNPYRPNPPRKLFFFCEALPPDGWRSGGSPIVDTRALYRAIDPAIREKFERLGVQYMYHNADRNHDDRLVSWQSSFKTDDRAAAERVCKREGHNFEWTTDGGLVRWVVSPPCRPHHQTGEMCWFNQITAMHASYFHSHPTYPELYGVPEPSPITLLENPQGEPYSFHTRYGDGTEIPREVITYLRNTIWSHAVGFDWCEGDLLVIDNYCVMHARRGYADTPEQRRKMYIALTDGTENS